MNSSNEIGQLGENIAEKLLIEKGYQILERNWRFKKAEIDLIAKHKDVLIFVEVKARRHAGVNPPEASVDHKKQILIFSAANAYMDQINHTWEVRFDIITIIFDPEKNPNINHHEDAFFF